MVLVETCDVFRVLAVASCQMEMTKRFREDFEFRVVT